MLRVKLAQWACRILNKKWPCCSIEFKGEGPINEYEYIGESSVRKNVA